MIYEKAGLSRALQSAEEACFFWSCALFTLRGCANGDLYSFNIKKLMINIKIRLTKQYTQEIMKI